MNIKTMLAVAVLSASALAGASPASAMPFAPASGDAPLVQNVAWGCGPGWRPNRWGRCVPFGPVYGRPFYRRRMWRRW